VKGERVLAVVGNTISKRFQDSGVLFVIKRQEIYTDNGTGLGVQAKQLILGSCV